MIIFFRSVSSSYREDQPEPGVKSSPSSYVSIFCDLFIAFLYIFFRNTGIFGIASDLDYPLSQKKSKMVLSPAEDDGARVPESPSPPSLEYV